MCLYKHSLSPSPCLWVSRNKALTLDKEKSSSSKHGKLAFLEQEAPGEA